jgi:hypothetical protein
VVRLPIEHRPGVHCGSTALADALRVGGVEVSEPMVFGLGAGLGFFALAAPALSPSHQIIGRSARLELAACEALAVPCLERTADDAEAAWAGVRAAVERGQAPVLSTDLAELPYWRTRTRFGGHRVVLAGYDAGRGVALLADTDRPDLEEVPLDALDAARASLAPPFGMGGRPWLEVAPRGPARPLAEATPGALRRQASEMLPDVDGVAGVSALERFAAELPGWHAAASDEADRRWCFRFAYQVIELRGTGGGLFRGLYARFLREAEGVLPALAATGLGARMEALAADWSRLAAGLREVADVPGAAVPPELAAHARALAAAERRFFEELAARGPR